MTWSRLLLLLVVAFAALASFSAIASSTNDVAFTILPNARTLPKDMGPQLSPLELQSLLDQPKHAFRAEDFPRLYHPSVMERFFVDRTEASQPTIFGVNLGCWMILESWCVPSVFRQAANANVVDEWTWGQYLGNAVGSNGYNILNQHWTTYVQETDVKALSQVGITHVRIPVGYWAFYSRQELNSYGEPYVTGGQLAALQSVVALLKKYKILVLLDLHGAPGSQNGQDHSGRRGPLNWGTGNTVNRTLDAVQRLCNFVAQLEKSATTSGTVFGIELLNEPTVGKISGQLTTLKNYYMQGYKVVRKALGAAYTVVIQDGYWYNSWTNFMPSPTYQNVMLDTHVYHCFGSQNLTQAQHISSSCGSDKKTLASQTLPLIVGEWSLQTGNSSTNQDSAFELRWGLAQMNAYEYASSNSRGWFFWNFKTDYGGPWSFLQSLGKILPASVPSTEKSACS